jgi:hypothetical protein
MSLNNSLTKEIDYQYNAKEPAPGLRARDREVIESAFLPCGLNPRPYHQCQAAPQAALRKAEGEIAEFWRFQSLTSQLVEVNRPAVSIWKLSRWQRARPCITPQPRCSANSGNSQPRRSGTAEVSRPCCSCSNCHAGQFPAGVEVVGTAVPVVKEEETGDWQGALAEQAAHAREVKPGCVSTQTKWDEKGYAIRDPGSTTYVGAIEAAEEFRKRLYLEAWKRAWSRTKVKPDFGDGAEWI